MNKLCNGFSLLEVLISMFLLAVGIIGSVGMHLAALRTTHQSALQTTALQLAAGIADAIRSNGNPSAFANVDYLVEVDSEPNPPGMLCYQSECNAGAFVDFEIYEWKRHIRSTLPSGRMLICYDERPWDAANNTLTWGCSGSPGSNAPLVIKLGWQGKNPDGTLVKSADSFPPRVVLTVAPA